jgi:hypothetical protein
MLLLSERGSTEATFPFQSTALCCYLSVVFRCYKPTECVNATTANAFAAIANDVFTALMRGIAAGTRPKPAKRDTFDCVRKKQLIQSQSKKEGRHVTFATTMRHGHEQFH